MSAIIDIRKTLIETIDRLGQEESAKHLGVSKNAIQKWIGGNLDAAFTACQALINDLIEQGAIVSRSSLSPQSSGKRANPKNVAAQALPADTPALIKDLANIFGPDVADKIPGWLKTFTQQGSLFVQSIPMGKDRDVIHGAVDPEGASIKTEATEVAKTPASYRTKIEPPKETAVKTKDLTRLSQSDVAILLPTHRDFPPAVMLGILAQWKATLPDNIRPLLASVDMEYDALIHRSRNLLAMRFLASDKQWSVWFDSDILPPTGNPQWFRAKTGVAWKDDFLKTAAIVRLPGHGKTIVSGVYAERGAAKERRMVNSIGYQPQNSGEKGLAKQVAQGPVDKLVEASWAGMGCIAIHRKVFEDIIAKCPDIKPKKPGEPYRFFSAFEIDGPEGEDTAFAKRAKQAGHSTFIDLGCIAGHLGRTPFLP